MRMALEKSPSAAGITDYIDIYMAHNIKLPQFRDDLFAELAKVKDEGKIREWGVSLGPAIGWREEGIKAMVDHQAKAVQTVYNLFEQSPGREFCETAQACRAGVLQRGCMTTAAFSRTKLKSTRRSALRIIANFAINRGKSTA